jgi:oligopeptidase B
MRYQYGAGAIFRDASDSETDVRRCGQIVGLTFVIGFVVLANINGSAIAADLPLSSGAATDRLEPAQRQHPLPPPVAPIKPKTFEAHGTRWTDDYYWMRDRDSPDLLSYLKAENDYAAQRLKLLQPLIDELETELYERAEGAQESPAFRDNGYIYQRRTAEGADFPIVVRRRDADAREEIVLDIPRLAQGHKHYDLADYAISDDGKLVAFAVDFSGGRSHRLFIRDIATGHITDTGISGAASDLVFSGDGRHLFYLRVEAKTVRSYQLWRHHVGQPTSLDQLIFEEPNPTLALSVKLSKSRRFILVDIDHEQSSEVRYLPADQPLSSLMLIEPRRAGMTYEVDHIDAYFYIRTNLDAPDFRVMRAPENAPSAMHWINVVAQTPGRYISHIELFESFIALVEEHDAVQTTRVFTLPEMTEIAVPRPADIGVMTLDFAQGASNRDASSHVLQVRFSGPKHPNVAFEFDTKARTLTARGRSRAWRWFDTQAYELKRVAATAPDGEQIPVTLIYRRNKLRNGGNPTLISGYGAYGLSMKPDFADVWFSLIDRGFVYAIAHARGGLEKGQRWHDGGRLLAKRNSFTDFIAVTDALVAEGVADRRRVFAHGGSAGGLLVATVANMRPELYAGIVAEVPFVDMIATMTDPTVPLTTLEYAEWGDPTNRQQFENMLSYSPYDNVAARTYPPMFVTAGLNDSQVGVHEPAKWVARLRRIKADSNELLFVTNMEAGHSGSAGRFASTSETAQVMAWLLALASRTN